MAIIDAWIQHPTPAFIGDPMFESLRRWMGLSTLPSSIPIEFTLAALDARKSRIAELRFFAGLSLEEAGHVLQVSPRTVERDWDAARAWLFKTLSGDRRAAGASTGHDT